MDFFFTEPMLQGLESPGDKFLIGKSKTDGISKGGKRQLSPMVEHGDSNPVFDIT